ncbi:MAG: CPBP family intramembrane glutamic endopeptidase [Verrucomicrobiota bacterium]
MPDSLTTKRLSLVLPAMCLPLLASILYFVIFPGTVFGKSCYVGVKVFLLCWPIIAAIFLLKERLFPKFEKVQLKKSIIWGTIFGLATFGTMFGLLKFSPMSEVIYSNGDKIAQKVDDLGVAEHFILFGIFISFLHAALEEFFWRLFVFGQLRKTMPWVTAMIIGSLGFAAHHIVILSQFVPIGWAVFFGLCVGLGGAVWCIIYQKTNTLWGAWVSHMIIDLAIFWIGWEVLQMQV